MKELISKLQPKISPGYILSFFLICAFVFGYFLSLDYGMSWDIIMQMAIGKYNQTYLSFENFFHPAPFDFPGHEKYYGPIHEILIQTVIVFFSKFNLRATELQLTYWMNFSSFLLGVFFFYHLARRYMREWMALLSALLFFSQPLLFGHAFINSKDIPFLSFFTASVFLGLKMIEQLEGSLSSSEVSDLKIGRFVLREWKEYPSKRKHFVVRFVGGWGIALLLVLIFWSILTQWVASIIFQSMQVENQNILGQLFLPFAESANVLPPEAYVTKGVILFTRFVRQIFFFSFLFLVAASISALPKTVYKIWQEGIRIYIFEFFSKKYIGKIAKLLFNKWILLAGIFAGIATSIRVLGPAVAGLVAFLFIWKKKEKSLAPITAYFLVMVFTTYLTWPILWSTGLGGVFQTVKVMADFPWNSGVLFRGALYKSFALPASYLPVLLSVQLTEPVLIGFIGGFLLLLWLKKQQNIDPSLFGLLILWFFLPFWGVILFRPNIYDNFRQFLFILPPVFIIAGIGFGWLSEKITIKWVNVLLAIGILLPGILAVLRLHPYEYAYYNSFVGGENGAFRQFEMDYWAISTNEATDFINENAPENAKVLVSGPHQNVRWYGRKDLEVVEIEDVEKEFYKDYDYAILMTRGNADLEFTLEATTVFQIKRGDVVYIVVREIKHE